MIVSASAQSRVIQDRAAKLGVPLPTPFLDAIEAARVLPKEAAALSDNAQLHAAALTAIAAGRDPGTDETVQRLTIHRVLAEGGIRPAAESYSNDLIIEAINTHANAIVTGWATAIQPDLDCLSNAAEQIDLDALDAAEPLLLKRSGKLNLWVDATTAAERADVALAGLRGICTALHIPNNPSVNALMLAPDADLDTVKAVAAMGGRTAIKAWDVAKSGATLRLATIADFTAGIARLAAEDQARQRQAEADEAANAQKGKQQWTQVR